MEFTDVFSDGETWLFESREYTIFIFIGVIIALVQGGYVRRKGNRREKRMAVNGLVPLGAYPNCLCSKLMDALWRSIFPSSRIFSKHTNFDKFSFSLYACERTGRSIGRSLQGSCSRRWPLLAAVIYWRVGRGTIYLWKCFLLIPIIMISRLKNRKSFKGMTLYN